VLKALYSPDNAFIPWSDVFGHLFTDFFENYLPAEGLDPKVLFSSLPIALISVSTVKAVTLFYQWFTWEWIGEQMARNWRSSLAAAFVHLKNESRDDGLVKSEEEQIGGVIAQDIRVLKEFVVHYYGGLPREGLQVIFTGIALFALSPKLFGVFILCISPIGIVLSRVGRRIRKRANRALNDNSQLSEWIQQRLLGIETIKHARFEHAEVSRMKAASVSLFQKFKDAARLKSRTSPMIEFFGVASMSIALWVAFDSIATGENSGAVVMSFFASLALFAQAAAKLGRYFNSNQDGKAAGKRLLNILGALKENNEAKGGNHFIQFTDTSDTKLKVSDLCVSYGSVDVLKNMNCEFSGGKIYCLVGKSGAGKSSFFNAVLGLKTPSKGRIVASYPTVKYGDRNAANSIKILSVPQQIPVIPTSLERNISYPFLVANEEEASLALKKSQFNIDPARLRFGLKTLVGPGNLQLSGGEAQRLQLARLYYHNSPFVLIDEGTSALDPITEQEVLATLRTQANKGACVIMIAHRKAAAQFADEVIVLEKGQISLSGPPSEVLSSEIARSVFGN
jgi:ABC-type multidrug transport system fused ATPase/permease subunit